MRSILQLLLPVPFLILLLVISRPVSASNGVAEISHACAVHTGCFAGDTAGYPVTITRAAGPSYTLTSDLRRRGLEDHGLYRPKYFGNGSPGRRWNDADGHDRLIEPRKRNSA
jgi:hypothetical protein